MLFEIKHRVTGSVLFSLEIGSLKLAVEAAVAQGANLDGANLYGANLDGANLDGANLDVANLVRANLYGANLDGANLDGANLYGANLYGANLVRANLVRANLDGANLDVANLDGANLYGANLDGANLDGANLDGANLVRANLVRANLVRANLYGANLDGANLVRANLQPIRDDIWAVLSSAPNEVAGLRAALVAGKVNGSSYEGECACLVGTIAKCCGMNYESLPVLKPNADRPAERFFMAIKPGHTPENSVPAKLAVEWIDDWLTRMRAAFSNTSPAAPSVPAL